MARSAPKPRQKSKRTPLRRVVKRPKRTARKTEKRGTNRLHPVVFWVIGGIGITIASFIFGWKFILPSVLFSYSENQNTVFVSETLSGSKSVILFAKYAKNNDESVVFGIDGSQRVLVTNGYGEYALESLYPLLHIDNQDPETIRSIFSRVLGVAIDQISVMEPLDQLTFSKSAVQKQLLSQAKRELFRNPRTSIALLRTYFIVASASDLSILPYQEIRTALQIENIELSPDARNCSLAIVNTTTTSGLAAQTSALLEQNGLYVIREDSTPTNAPQTVLQRRSPSKGECDLLLEKLKTFFPATVEVTMQDKDTARYRADIVILLGEDTVSSR